MATATLHTFNAFLTDRLTAAAVDIYGFVEKTITDYQEEVYRTKMENQRLQRLLDLVYKPEIRLHRAGMFVRSHRALRLVGSAAAGSLNPHQHLVGVTTPQQV